MKVSVIIPAYNVEKYINESVRSVVREFDTGIYEIVIVEDGSTDKTMNRALSLKDEFPDKIKLFQHDDKRNHGTAAARNLGIMKARGEWCTFLDADDFWLPGRMDYIKRTTRRKMNNIDGIYDRAIFQFDSEIERKLFNGLPEELGTVKNIKPENLFAYGLRGEYLFGINNIFIKIKSLRKIGLLEEGLRFAEDDEYVLRMAMALRLIRSESIIPKVVVRRHGSNRWYPFGSDRISSNKTNVQVYETLLKNANVLKADEEKRALILEKLIYLYRNNGEVKKIYERLKEEAEVKMLPRIWRQLVPGPRTLKIILRSKFRFR